MNHIHLTPTKLKKLSEGKSINLCKCDLKPKRGKKAFEMKLTDEAQMKYDKDMENKGKFKLHKSHIIGGSIWDKIRHGFQNFGNKAKSGLQTFGNDIKNTYNKVAPIVVNGYNKAAPGISNGLKTISKIAGAAGTVAAVVPGLEEFSPALAAGSVATGAIGCIWKRIHSIWHRNII